MFFDFHEGFDANSYWYMKIRSKVLRKWFISLKKVFFKIKWCYKGSFEWFWKFYRRFSPKNVQKSTFSKNHSSNFFDIFFKYYAQEAYLIIVIGEIRRRIRIFGQIWLLTSYNRYLVKKINKKIWFFSKFIFFSKVLQLFKLIICDFF